MSGSRTILHVDMDAFYVSAELLRRPELVGLPVVVGGTGDRGVVAASSYEARRFGVFSAMSSAMARRLCPHAVFLPGDHAHYAQLSTRVHELFHEVTPLVEPIALDEAFLDVTGARRLHGDGVAIARRLRTEVHARLGLGCSVGVAASKFDAKVASKAAKPVPSPSGVLAGPGVVEVRAGDEVAFLHPLPVRALWGVGPATLARLDRLGVRTVRDLAGLGEQALVSALGEAHGRHLALLARGIDPRPVEPERALKSIGHEETFARDLHGVEELRTELVRLADAVAARVRRHGTGARTITLKVKYHDFTLVTRAVTLPGAIDTGSAVWEAAARLLEQVDTTRGIRLLGVSASRFAEPSQQLALDVDAAPGCAHPDADGTRWEAASGAIDEIRERFGTAAIGPATTVGPRGVRPVRPGAQQWGPDAVDAERRRG